MRLTLLTDYALRVLMHLAQRPGVRCTIAEIATAHGISQAHLMKVTLLLGRHGWITTTRGRGGGIALACAPAEINLGRVVRDLEPGFDLVECFSVESRCTLTGGCRLTGVFEGALREFLGHLDGYTLADIVPAPVLHPLGVASRS